MSSSIRRRSLRLEQRRSTDSVHDSSCIDLTEDSISGEVVDLTNSVCLPPTNLNPVVLPLSPDNIQAVVDRRGRRSRTSTRRSPRHTQTADRSVEIISTPVTTSRRNRNLRDGPVINLEESIQILSPASSVITLDTTTEDDSMSISDCSLDITSSPAGLSVLSSPIPVKITCPICMDDDRLIKRTHRQLTSTVCGHIFCSKCIKQSLRSFHTCPTCRKPLRQNQIHPIFL